MRDPLKPMLERPETNRTVHAEHTVSDLLKGSLRVGDEEPILSNKFLPNCPSKVARTSNEFVHKFHRESEEIPLAPESFLLKCRRHRGKLGLFDGQEMAQKA